MVRTGTKKASSSGVKSLGNGNSAPLRVSMIPRPYMRVSGTHEGVQVSGCDVLFQVIGPPNSLNVNPSISSKVTQAITMFANPGLSAVFPKLSNIAQVYDRAIIKSLKLVYYPTVSMIQEGQIGLVIQEDPNDPVPSNMIDLAQYKCSSLTSICVSGSADYQAKGRVMLPIFTESNVPSGSASNPFYQGLVKLSVLTSGLAVGMSYGYIGLHYSMELLAMKNPAPKFINYASNVADGPNIPINPPQYQAFTPSYSQGNFANTGSSSLKTLWNGVWNNVLIPYLASSFTVPAGHWQANARLAINAAPTARVSSSEVVIVEDWINPAFREKEHQGDDEKFTEIERPRRVLAAGDIAWSIYGQYLDSDSPVVQVANMVVNSAGATVFPGCMNFILDRPMRLAAQVFSPDVNRTMANYVGSLLRRLPADLDQ